MSEENGTSDTAYSSISDETLNQLCPIYYDKQNTTNGSDASKLTSSNNAEYVGQLELKRDRYIEAVEKGNTYISDLSTIESDYFTKKYGSGVYRYLVEKRNEYIGEQNQSSVNAGSSNSITTEELDELINEVKGEYDQMMEMKELFNSSLKNIRKGQEKIVGNVSEQQNATELNRRKMQYRADELLNNHYWNSAMTYTYYALLVIYIMTLFAFGRLRLGLLWPLYMVLFLFPLFIYPYIFTFVQRLILYLDDKMVVQGPKNSFANEKIKLEFIDPHNI